MASPFDVGAQGAPSEYAPLTMDRYITGLVTNRSALRDADVPYLQGKFYSAGRYDSLIDGINVEISAQSTLIRRPGTSVYNSRLFPPVNRFYSHRTVVDGKNVVHVMADTATTVYDATGPSTQTAVWSKTLGITAPTSVGVSGLDGSSPTGAQSNAQPRVPIVAVDPGKTCFQSVGNTLYFANAVDNRKWMCAKKAWAPGKVFAAGDWIVDPNNNIQIIPPQATANIQSVTITNNTLVVEIDTSDPFKTLQRVTFAGLTTATFLNGVTVTAPIQGSGRTFQCAYAHADYPTAPETGTVTAGAAAATSGVAAPAWSQALKAITTDGDIQWVMWGSSVQKWGIVAPAAAPSVVQVQAPTSLYEQWQPNTTYSKTLTIIDASVNVQVLTKGGVTGSQEPVWSSTAGQVTQDGTAEWTCGGTAVWHGGMAYKVGDYVKATYTYYVTTTQNAPKQYNTYDGQPTNGGQTYTSQQAVTETDLYICTTAGVSGAQQPGWQNGVGIMVADGSVVWTNKGPGTLTWAGLVGAGASVSTASKILDSNGYLQDLSVSGKSGAAVPAWATIQGASTTDNTITWTRDVAYSAASSYSRTWAFAYCCSIDDSISTASPISSPVIIGTGKLPALQGACSIDPQVDTLVIYRTAQNGAILFELDRIPQPFGTSIWSYLDTADDTALTIELQAAQAHLNDPPPQGIRALAFHVGRIFAAVDNLVYWCTGPDSPAGNGLTAWSPSNVATFPDSVQRIHPVTITNGALFVYSTSDMYAIFGDGTTGNVFQPKIYGPGIGLLNHDALDIIGSTIHMFTSNGKQVSLDPSAGYTETGFGIGDQFKLVKTGGISTKLYDSSSTFVTWHESETNDTGLYVADGAVGWFRYSPIASPETGFLWSPRAAIEGGTSAVQSVHTAPGVQTLLIGAPSGVGPILMRDLSVNADNSTAYADMYATIGSIQLCQPYEECEVAGVVLDSKRIGTAPTIGILYGEIEETVEVPFDMYERTTQDPPNLPPSATTFNDRFSTMQDGKPTVCRHMQLLIQWSPENARSELLTHTIYGAKHSERKVA